MEYNPNLAPGFVHVEDVAAGPGSLKLVTFPDGLRCYTHSSVEETEFIYNEVFVAREYLRHGVSLEDAACVLDVGANIGFFTLLAKRENPGAVVHAFEPIKETCEVLQRNVQLNRLENVHVHNCAVGSEENARRAFTYYPHMAGNSTATPSLKEGQLNVMKSELGEALTEFLFRPETRLSSVRVLTAFLAEQGIPSVDLLKIDVEGDELAVLRGIDAKAFALIRRVVIETHAPHLAQDACKVLKREGFTVTYDEQMSVFPGIGGVYAIRDGTGVK
jgi:FkbM family methyltransferase